MSGTDIVRLAPPGPPATGAKPTSIEDRLDKGRVSLDADANVDYQTDVITDWYGGSSPQDHTIALAAQKHADGKTLVDLHAVIEEGKTPFIEQRMSSAKSLVDYLPRLAVARADLRRIECRIWGHGRIQYRTSVSRVPRWLPIPRWKLEFHTHLGNTRTGHEPDEWIRATAGVPIVPPIHRQKDTLANYLILFEPEWHAPKAKRPPRAADPALLRHLVGDLYEVAATWELSSLEAAALRRG